MKRLCQTAVCLATALALNAASRAGDAVSADNPYAPLVAHNVFGLNPPAPAVAPDVAPPQKIIPNGIMSVFGHLQVLFKVTSPAKLGKPAEDIAYILAEGQRQDDIEVTRIDEKSGVVTFNNHGLVQELPLAKAPALNSPMPALVPARFNPVNPVAARPLAAPGGNNAIIGFGSRPGGGRGSLGGLNSGSAGYGGNQAAQSTQQTREAQAAQIELNRIATQPQVDAHQMPPLPPTMFTPPAPP
jgi:hypothetical protein